MDKENNFKIMTEKYVTRNYNFPKSVEDYINELVKSGAYSSPSEFIREILSKLMEQEEHKDREI